MLSLLELINWDAVKAFLLYWFIFVIDVSFLLIVFEVYKPSYGKTNHNEFDDEI